MTNRIDCCWENFTNFEIRVGTNLTDNVERNPRCRPKYARNVRAGQTVTVNCTPPLLENILTVYL